MSKELKFNTSSTTEVEVPATLLTVEPINLAKLFISRISCKSTETLGSFSCVLLSSHILHTSVLIILSSP
jgi:hypothetical protein